MTDANFDNLMRRVARIETIIYGDTELNIPSINDRLKVIDTGIEGINKAIEEMLRSKERERWTQYAITFFLALTSVSMIAIFVALSQLLRQ